MVTIPVKTRLEADGVLNLRVPTGLPEVDVVEINCTAPKSQGYSPNAL